MTPEHADITRRVREALRRGLIPPPGATTIAGCPAYVEVDYEAGIAHIRLTPPVYSQEIEIGFEPCE